jgi:hypothetical protein
MSEPAEFKRATLAVFDGKGPKPPGIPVHFNPVSLQYTVSNTLKEEGQGKKKKQYVTQSSAKLTMDLVFDTTHTGEDVRITTEKVAKLMEPVAEGNKKVPSVVEFDWGSYSFRGMVESYKETIDFFAPNGVPLRAAINLTLTRQDEVFSPGQHQAAVDTRGSLATDTVQVPTTDGAGAAQAAAAGGDPFAGRALAGANNQPSMRFAAGASLIASASVELKPPAAFATGGAGIDLSAGAGIGLSVGGGIGLSAGAGISAGGGIGLSAGAGVDFSAGGALGFSATAGAGFSAGGGIGFSAGAGVSFTAGGAASAGVSASEGAFAGLGVRAEGIATTTLDPTRLLPQVEVTPVDTGGGFRLGGQAQAEAGGFRADVGARASIRFDGG